ncbi:MAG: NAD-dependent epimerase/dehydratase family protein [Candidatus Nanoarchaeia archaeon]|nr:NAD-dependent epimerase/dehydratase family protein [Candidatus Nanoarchaeia archaeon]
MIVVTGGSGFIGSHVVDKLKEAGHEVRVFDVTPPKQSDVEFVKGDITNIDDLKSALKDVEAVYHLAAVSNVNSAFENPLMNNNLNIMGTANVLEAVRQTNVKRMLFASTVWVYGACRDEQVYEGSPFYMPGAGHVYTSSKIAGELLCHDYQKLYGTDFTVFRYGIPYGPRARGATVLPIFVEKAMKGEPLTIQGDGLQHREFIYVEDLADGNVAGLKDAGKNQTYNLCGDEPVTIKEMAETVRKLFDNKVDIIYQEARPGDFKGKLISNRKAKAELGWKPKVSFEEGVRRYIQWLKENKT